MVRLRAGPGGGCRSTKNGDGKLHFSGRQGDAGAHRTKTSTRARTSGIRSALDDSSHSQYRRGCPNGGVSEPESCPAEKSQVHWSLDRGENLYLVSTRTGRRENAASASGETDPLLLLERKEDRRAERMMVSQASSEVPQTGGVEPSPFRCRLGVEASLTSAEEKKEFEKKMHEHEMKPLVRVGKGA